MTQQPGPAARFFDRLFTWLEKRADSTLTRIETWIGAPINGRSATNGSRQANMKQVRERLDSNISRNPAMTQNLVGFLRLILFLSILFLFSLLGGYLFENVNAAAIALLAKTTNPLLKPVPMWLLKVVIYILHPQNARYMVMPLAAMLLILIGSAYFVSDVYHLSKPGLGWRYVIASMFAVRYPTLTVDGGKKQTKADEVNLLDAIGGPGYALIQPGNAVLFRTLRQPSQTSITSSYFMSPFETIGSIVNLDDQHVNVEEATTITRDGIRVILRDINLRFRILPEMRTGRPIMRSLENPFPFSQDAMQTMAYNLAVMADGQDPWRMAVQRAVVGSISEFINGVDIDFLTAPKAEGVDPRGRIRNALTDVNIGALRRLGAELIWVDIGHFDIEPPEVDLKRVNSWAAQWENRVKQDLAEAEGIRDAYLEVGQEVRQAALINAIVRSLGQANVDVNDPERWRALILSRTAQILDTLRKNRKTT